MKNKVNKHNIGSKLDSKFVNLLGHFSINPSNRQSVKENIEDIKHYVLPENASSKRVRTLELGKSGEEVFDGIVKAQYQNHTLFVDLAKGLPYWFNTKDYDVKFGDNQIAMKHRSVRQQLRSNKTKKYKVEDNKVYQYAWEKMYENSNGRYKIEDNKVFLKNALNKWIVWGNEARYKEVNSIIYLNKGNSDWELIFDDDKYYVEEENGKVWYIRKDAKDWNLVYDNGVWVETSVKILNDGYRECGKSGDEYLYIGLGNEREGILLIRIHQLVSLFSNGILTLDCIGENSEKTLAINHILYGDFNGSDNLEITTPEGNKAHAHYEDKAGYYNYFFQALRSYRLEDYVGVHHQ